MGKKNRPPNPYEVFRDGPDVARGDNTLIEIPENLRVREFATMLDYVGNATEKMLQGAISSGQVDLTGHPSDEELYNLVQNCRRLAALAVAHNVEWITECKAEFNDWLKEKYAPPAIITPQQAGLKMN